MPVLIFGAELAFALFCGMQIMGDSMMNRIGELTICILLWLLFVRLVALLISFGFAFYQAAPPNQQKLRTWIRPFFQEFGAILLAFTFLIPFRLFFAPRRGSRPTEETETVLLLVHGLLSNSGVWWWFSRQLQEALAGTFTRLSVDSLDLGRPFASIDTYANVLNHKINVIRKNKNAEIILIGHSMGGLVCRAWLSKNGRQNIRRLITIGTPHRGSECATFFGFANLKQMRPQSNWLQNLPAQPCVKTTAIYSSHDNLVVPFSFGCSPDFDSIELGGTGHLGLLFNQQVITTVKNIVRAD